MKERTKFVAVLFGPGRRSGEMVAPGDADCRWRAAATLDRAAVNDETASLEDPAGETAGADGPARQR